MAYGRRHRRLRFKVGDIVTIDAARALAFNRTPIKGAISHIDRRRVRPYKVEGFWMHCSEDQLCEIFEANTLLKNLIDKM